jgi:hypothetical protein
MENIMQRPILSVDNAARGNKYTYAVLLYIHMTWKVWKDRLSVSKTCSQLSYTRQMYALRVRLQWSNRQSLLCKCGSEHYKLLNTYSHGTSKHHKGKQSRKDVTKIHTTKLTEKWDNLWIAQSVYHPQAGWWWAVNRIWKMKPIHK